ncbi:brain acid soluble protein 1-like [Panicum virgatum]|uniref:brain acid soluble protein 1-like n=1 Tax=Panicum virgatum TaxID=38727 RepID=UPI0019D5F511|nr:brain acid soluble protein 1-like [Panicum virgatum]
MAGSPPPVQQWARVEASAPAAGEKGPAPVAIEKAPALRADRRSPTPAAGRGSPTLTLILSFSPALSSLKVDAPDTALLAPSKVLKSEASATQRSAAQPPTGGPQALEAAAAELREALIRGAQRVHVQTGMSDSGHSSAAVAARSGAEEEAGRRSEEHAARPDAGDEAGRGGVEDAAQSGVGDDAGRGDVDDAARPGAGGGETCGDVSERPASQSKEETLTPEPTGAGDEGAAATAEAQTAPVVEVYWDETPVAAAPAEATPGAEAPAEDPWEVAIATAAVASTSEGGFDT